MSDKEKEKQLCFPSSVSLFLKNPALTAYRMETDQLQKCPSKGHPVAQTVVTVPGWEPGRRDTVVFTVPH